MHAVYGDKYATRGKTGGPNHVVQIDECKIGRQKFHKGRVVEGNWILGMIDMNTKAVRMAIVGDLSDNLT